MGCSNKHVDLDRLPGWDPPSWAYHGDDGKAYAGNTGKLYGETFGTGDVIGCQISFEDGVSFTKNGISLGKN